MSEEEKIEPAVRPTAALRPTIVRLGHGANCSSIGSVVDTLFVGAVLGSAIFAAVAAAMQREGITIAGKKKPDSNPSANEKPEEKSESEDAS